MWNWIKTNAEPLEAVGALATALVALIALVGVKLQIDTQERLQQTQQAHEIYREFLTLSVNQPRIASLEFAAITTREDIAAYEFYVEHILYTAEQLLRVSPDWEGAMKNLLQSHRSYLCSRNDWSGYTPEVTALITGTRAELC